jgi:Icc-related predicted phosphoesterase
VAWLRRSNQDGSAPTLFFATDLHGSERCFRKFLNAADAYNSSILVIGGDITGKRITPLVRSPGGAFIADHDGRRVVLECEQDVDAFIRGAADRGYYTFEASEEEVGELRSDPEAVERVFLRLATERLTSWLKLAEERVDPRRTTIYINCGNDDPFELDQLIESSPLVRFPEGKLLELAEGWWMASVGYANLTPWQCIRDIPEDELGRRIEDALADWSDERGKLVLNLHCPPYDSGLDTAALLNEDLSPVTSAGNVVDGPCGSHAVKAAIDQHRPALSLHGHIHESRAATSLGSTLAINPGSEYPEGILRGALVTLDRKRIRYVLTSG